MALEVRTLRDQAPPGGPLPADRRLCLAADETTMVEADDPRARFLLVGAGGEIPAPVAARLGLAVVDGRVVQRAAAAPAVEKVEPNPAAEKVAPPVASAARRKRGG